MLWERQPQLMPADRNHLPELRTLVAMPVLIADIGGTNSRCALADVTGPPHATRSFANAGFAGLAEVLAAYLRDLPPAGCPRRALLAIAAPIRGEEITMPNRGWHTTVTALRAALGLDELQVMNDFAALAHALPELSAADVVAAGGGTALANAPKVVLGPGTGLGVAGLAPLPGGGWQALPGEGGHVTLGAHDEQEERIIALARRHFGHCSAERLLSGAGLSFLHDALHGTGELAPALIGARALGGDAPARATLETFFRLLGTVAGDAALTLGALGGVYIGGGIVPRYRDAFLASGFRARFEAKGRYRDYLRAIPTWLIVAGEPTLTGLNACVRRGY